MALNRYLKEGHAGEGRDSACMRGQGHCNHIHIGGGAGCGHHASCSHATHLDIHAGADLDACLSADGLQLLDLGVC